MGWAASLGAALRQVFSFVPRGIPARRLLPLCLLLFCESFTASAVASYVGFMMVDLGVAESPEDSGYYSGVLYSVFFGCQFLSSFFISVLSDKFGRRTLILLGSFGNMLATISFGFSFNYAWAAASRALNGLLNGNVSVIKNYLADISDGSNRVQTFSLIGLMWGIGSIVGTSVSGFLARPAIQYPNIFSSKGIFGRFPYALPNLVSASLLAFGLVLSFFFLPETKRPSPARNHGDDSDMSSQDDSVVEMEDAGLHEELHLAQAARNKCAWAAEVVKGHLSRAKAFVFDRENIIPVFVCLLYSLVSFTQTAIFSILSVWLMAPLASGGLGFTTKQIGICFALSSVSNVMLVAFLYVRIVRLLRLVRSFRFAVMLAGPLILAHSLLPLVAPLGPALLWTALVTVSITTQGCMQICFSTVLTLQVNSVLPEKIAAVNGLSQSLASLSRTACPVIVSPLLAWSLRHKFPLDYHLTFVLTAVSAVLAFGLSCLMPRSLDSPRGQPAQLSETVTEAAAQEESRNSSDNPVSPLEPQPESPPPGSGDEEDAGAAVIVGAAPVEEEHAHDDDVVDAAERPLVVKQR
eukprot:TRINITY_DN4069_c0_g1_i1.p1 TRINITY_DN4069_c0_g1~~TRINITY_DN4069_c0_g1_i1.p1  ORF type:complete len:579 (+),score=107.38 TRINITY_DN4069_c0_g1_i1:26-1762(+)